MALADVRKMKKAKAKNDEMIINGTLSGEFVRILIDTGASLTFVSGTREWRESPLSPKALRRLFQQRDLLWGRGRGLRSQVGTGQRREPSVAPHVRHVGRRVALLVSPVPVGSRVVQQGANGLRGGLLVVAVAGKVQRGATDEEIQVLSAPPDVARHFPKKLQRLCGYDCHSTAISYYADWQ
mgnify:CR=1 FL=1